MTIVMTEDQSRKLATYLKDKRLAKEKVMGERYTWKAFAIAIGLTPETLLKLKGGKRGMQLDTFIALRTAFGIEMLDILGFPDDPEGTFKIEG